ncbi:hypothetical protein [Burkholderia sp. S-53]|uniref:hypothetical protein n=1 Tax=Burkholderia sp. S-53 TaxID=2906514 RepID=UPI0021D2E315|nr:hypothetical protein [Burkholderia sp. S-53]UXU91428.1 hypothetical protein LXM88_24995 [Burkholderia sp. S-53]
MTPAFAKTLRNGAEWSGSCAELAAEAEFMSVARHAGYSYERVYDKIEASYTNASDQTALLSVLMFLQKSPWNEMTPAQFSEFSHKWCESKQ